MSESLSKKEQTDVHVSNILKGGIFSHAMKNQKTMENIMKKSLGVDPAKKQPKLSDSLPKQK